jgi:hypothetical protein
MRFWSFRAKRLFFGGRGSLTATKTWRGAALVRDPRAPRDFRPSARAVANRIKQAAPANDPERGRSIRYARLNDLYARRRRRKNIALGNSREPPV